MTPATYLRDRAGSIAFASACAAAAAGLAAFLGASAQACAVIFVVALLVAAAAFACGYVRRRRFWRELDEAKEAPLPAWRSAALVEEPRFLEGALAWRALDEAGRTAADDLAAANDELAAYRTYVEAWVHEVKTPLAAAGLVADGLHGPEAAKLKGELERIGSCIDQALFYARASSLDRDYTIREVALADVCRRAARANARFLIERGVALDLEVPDEALVLADGKQLAFVLGQLLVNAAKYGASRVRLSCEGAPASAAPPAAPAPAAEPATPAAGDDAPTPCGSASGPLTLSVADDGWGIPAADVPRVFDRGFTGENGRRAGGSTGMGLYLAAVICERMGLSLSLASREGEGTRVLIAFPRDGERLAASRSLTGL